jgi:hypothetical protein
MSMTTHTLQLVAGPMHVAITETKTNVRFEITGPEPMTFEQDKVLHFLAPLVNRYETDNRSLSVGGRGADFVGHVAAVPGLGVVMWSTPAGGKP